MFKKRQTNQKHKNNKKLKKEFPDLITPDSPTQRMSDEVFNKNNGEEKNNVLGMKK